MPLAFAPTNPLPRPTPQPTIRSLTPRRPPLATLAAPSPAKTALPPTLPNPHNSPNSPLQTYQDFLRAGNARPDDAPVYQTADGGLVCEWNPAIAQIVALNQYERFLHTDEARGVDLSRPVYYSAEGRLVCKI